MDVNQINNNSISNLNSSSQLQINKANSVQKVNESKNNELSLDIGNQGNKKSEFSSNVQSLVDGIAMSKIATNALNKQQEYLQNIQTKLEDTANMNNKNDIKQSVNEDLRNFNKVSYETNYKKQSLLVQNYYDQTQNIDVNTTNQTFSMQKPNVSDYANQMFDAINNTDLNNPTNLEKAKQLVSNVSTELTKLTNNFDTFTKDLQSKATDAIKQQNDNLYKNSVNFGREATDFSKTNVSMNAGNLIVSQANIVQAQSVRLLS